MTARSKTVPFKLRLAVIERDGWRCVYCGHVHSIDRLHASLTMDHIVPRKRSGITHAANLVAACRNCNNARGSISMIAWLNRIVRAGRLDDARRAQAMVLRAMDDDAAHARERHWIRRWTPENEGR